MKTARQCRCGKIVVFDEQEKSFQHEGDACDWFRSLLLGAGLFEHDEPGLRCLTRKLTRSRGPKAGPAS
jgi:hypothetical protein